MQVLVESSIQNAEVDVKKVDQQDPPACAMRSMSKGDGGIGRVER